MTLKSNDTECAYCGSSIWDKAKELTSASTEQTWIVEEQLFWFSIDSINQKVNFYEPAVDKGFVKDKNWKPLITEEDIIDFSKYK